MKSEFFVFLCAFLATTVLSECHAAESDPYIFTTGTSAPPAVILVGATLGNNWDEFPYELMPDYNPTYTFEQLNVTLPLYVTWVMDSVEGPLPVQVNPPQPITSFSWYFSVGNRVVQISQDAFDQGYIACAQGDGLEWPTAGSFPISSGQMNVSDVHGGIGDRTTIVLQFSLDWASPGLTRT